METTSLKTPNNHKKEGDNKNNCEVLHCTVKATEKVKVNAGIYGFIKLSVCKKCKGIFDNQNKHSVIPVVKTTHKMGET